MFLSVFSLSALYACLNLFLSHTHARRSIPFSAPGANPAAGLFGGAGGGGGGDNPMAGLAGLLNNPQMMSMAQQMMQVSLMCMCVSMYLF